MSLHSYLSRLRAELGGRQKLQRRGSAYALSVSRQVLDSVRFEQAAHRGFENLQQGEVVSALGHFDRALNMWRETPYADLQEYAFARNESERLSMLRLTILEEQAAARLRLGDTRVDPQLQQAWKENPMRERLTARLMCALHANGRQTDALEVFQQTRTRLVEELGLDVCPELGQVHLDIIQQRT